MYKHGEDLELMQDVVSALADAPEDGFIAPLSDAEWKEYADIREKLVNFSRDPLKLYEPMEWQQKFHACKTRFVMARKGNRTGGTVAGAVELARIALNADPHKKIPTKNNLLISVVGLGWQHIGEIIYPMLFEPGAFLVIKDKKTKRYRAYRPWQDGEEKRAEAELAPPLIPPSALDGKPTFVNWGARYIKVARLKNGNVIRFYSSVADAPPTGDKPDYIWFDEDIRYKIWFTECQRGMADKPWSLFRWTARPHMTTDAIARLVQMAIDQGEKAKADPSYTPSTEVITSTFSGNVFISDKAKQETIEVWRSQGGEAEVALRDRGEMLADSILMYPTFDRYQHCITWDEYQNDFGGCEGWTRYCAIDPGHSVCSLLFCAVHPKDEFVVIEKVIYLKQSDMHKFGDAMLEHTRGKPHYAFIIDKKGADHADAGSGLRNIVQYTQALEQRGVTSFVGTGFIPGSTNTLGRAQNVRELLATKYPNPRPFDYRLRVVGDLCRPLIDAIPEYRKQIKHDDFELVSDKPDPKSAQKAHAPQCLEYMCAYLAQQWAGGLSAHHPESLNHVQPADESRLTLYERQSNHIQKLFDKFTGRKKRGKVALCPNSAR